MFGDEHVRKYEETGGKIGHDWNGASCLILRTIGSKTGKTRKFPLIYGVDGKDYVIVASKGGAPENPGWYGNLVKHPDVEIQVRDKVIPVRARTGDGRGQGPRVAHHAEAMASVRRVPARHGARHSGGHPQPPLTGAVLPLVAIVDGKPCGPRRRLPVLVPAVP